MKTIVRIQANVNGTYRIPLGEMEFEGDIFDFRSLIVRADVTDHEQAKILADALANKRIHYVNIETHIYREEQVVTHTD